jgi:hypothetical protein
MGVAEVGKHTRLAVAITHMSNEFDSALIAGQGLRVVPEMPGGPAAYSRTFAQVATGIIWPSQGVVCPVPIAALPQLSAAASPGRPLFNLPAGVSFVDRPAHQQAQQSTCAEAGGAVV